MTDAARESEVSDDDFDDAVEDLIAEADRLADGVRSALADREMLLERLGLTEHEWWCEGGQKVHDREVRPKLVRQAARTLVSLARALVAVARLPERAVDFVPDAADEPPPIEILERREEEAAVARVPASFAATPPRVPPKPPTTPPRVLPELPVLPAANAPPPLPPHLLANAPPPLPPHLLANAPPPPLPPHLLANAPPPLPPHLLVTATTATAFQWNEEQLLALDKIDAWWHSGDRRFISLTGPAGTGKTTLVRELVERYARLALSATTGRAAHRLDQVVGGRGASTIYKLMYYPPEPGQDVRFTHLREPEIDDVLVDECSMMTPTLFADLSRWRAVHHDPGEGVRGILVGDSFQLPPVITGEERATYGEDYSVFAEVPGPALRTVVRNAGGILQAATSVRETGEIVRHSIMDAVRGGEPAAGYEYVTDRSPVARAVKEYLADRDDCLLVTWRNAVRMKANKAIRAALGHEGPLPDEGEPVLVRKNGQGFLNGEIVLCGGWESGPDLDTIRTYWMRVGDGSGRKILATIAGSPAEKGGEHFDGGLPWIENWKKYHAQLKAQLLPEPVPLTWGYCVTCHAAQGGQARRTIVFLDKGDDRSTNFRKPTTLPSGETASFMARWVYTAITRSTRLTTMIVGR